MDRYLKHSLGVSMPASFKNKPEPYTKLYNLFYTYWQFYRFLGSLFGFLAIIPATFAYESSYSTSRTSETCQINSDITFYYRLIVLVLSFLGIIFELIYKVLYYKWVRMHMLTFIETRPPRDLSLTEMIELTRKRNIYEFFTDKMTFLAIIIYLIFPYPGVFIRFYVPQQMLYEKVSVCYYLEEVAYVLMFFRVFYLVFTAIGFGMLHEPDARKILQANRVPISSTFAVKAYFQLYPLYILIFCFLIPGILIFGATIRVLERPINSQDFDSYENSCWLAFITMLTIGYGDYFPVSLLGRIAACLTIFWGGIILSMTFSTVGSFIKLNKLETCAYREISILKDSFNVIKEFGGIIKYKKKKLGKKIWEKLKMLESKIIQNKSIDNEENNKFRAFISVQRSISYLFFKVHSIEYSLMKIKKYIVRLKASRSSNSN